MLTHGDSPKKPKLQNPADYKTQAFCLSAPNQRGDGIPLYGHSQGATAEERLLARVQEGMQGPLAKLTLTSAMRHGTKLCIDPAIFERGHFRPRTWWLGADRAALRPPTDFYQIMEKGNPLLVNRLLHALQRVAYEEIIHAYQHQQQKLPNENLSPVEVAISLSPAVESAAKVATYVAMVEDHRAGAAPDLATRMGAEMHEDSSVTVVGPYNWRMAKPLLDALQQDPKKLYEPKILEEMLIAFTLSREVDFYLLDNLSDIIPAELSARARKAQSEGTRAPRIASQTPLLTLLPEGQAKTGLSDDALKRIATLPGKTESYLSDDGAQIFRKAIELRLMQLTYAHLSNHIYNKENKNTGAMLETETYTGRDNDTPILAQGKPQEDSSALECLRPGVDEQFRRMSSDITNLIQMSGQVGAPQNIAEKLRSIGAKASGAGNYQQKAGLLREVNSARHLIVKYADDALDKKLFQGYQFIFYNIPPEGMCDGYRRVPSRGLGLN